MSNPGPPPYQPGEPNPYQPPEGSRYSPGGQNPYQPGDPGIYQSFPPPDGSTYQPYQQPPVPSPPLPTKHRGPTIAIAALAVIVIVLGIALGVQSGKSDDSAAVSPAATVTETAGGTTVTETADGTASGTAVVTATTTVTRTLAGNPTSADDSSTSADASDVPIVGKVGAPLSLVWTRLGKTAKGSVTVLSATRAASYGTSYKETPKNGVFVAVDVSYTSTSGAVSYNPYDWEMKDADGREYSSSFSSQSGLARLKSGSLAAGDKARGVIIFDVPKGALKLTYTIGLAVGASWVIPG